MPSGPNQHFIPRFFQKPFAVRPKRKEIWVFSRDHVPELKKLKKIGTSDYFYSGPNDGCSSTLDDKITTIETPISRKLAIIREQSSGAAVNSNDAAEIVNHLVPRTAHTRMTLARGLWMMFHNVEAISSDSSAVKKLMGLDEDEPTENFREALEEKFGEIVSDNPVLPKHLCERIMFCLIKENIHSLMFEMTPLIQDMCRIGKGLTEDIVKEAHNKALLEFMNSVPQLKMLEALNWTVQSAPAIGAILPDCVALAIDQTGVIMPAMVSDWDQTKAVIMPISPDKLLVGSKKDFKVEEELDYNLEAVKCSHGFFLSSTDDKRLIELSQLIGSRSIQIIDDQVNEAIAPYLKNEPLAENKMVSPSLLMKEAINKQPWQYEIVWSGCDEFEDVKRLSDTIKTIVNIFARQLPLHHLDSIIIASNYQQAIADAELGYDSKYPIVNVPEEFGEGDARTLAVYRKGCWEEQIIIDVNVIRLFLNKDAKMVELGLYVFMRQLADVAILEMISRKLPDVWLKPIKGTMENFLYPNIKPAIYGYLSSYLIAAYTDPLSKANDFRGRLIMSLEELKSTGNSARLNYRRDGNLDFLLSIILPRIKYTLQFAAELLGHCEGSGIDPFDGNGELEKVLRDFELLKWFPTFQESLRKLKNRFGKWETFDEFISLNICVERLMWQLGLFPFLDNEQIRIEIPIEIDIDELLKNEK